jgi:hypothetical protein
VGIGTGIIRLEKAQFLDAARRGDVRKLRYRFFNAADGVAGIPIAEGTCTGVRAADGRIWFVTSGGLTIVDPARVGPPPVMPPVRIESVTATRRSSIRSRAAGTVAHVAPAHRVHGAHAHRSDAHPVPLPAGRIRSRLDRSRQQPRGRLHEPAAAAVPLRGGGDQR